VSTTGVLWKKLLQPDNSGANLEEICDFLLQNLIAKSAKRKYFETFNVARPTEVFPWILILFPCFEDS
jgi:hypothetical protein